MAVGTRGIGSLSRPVLLVLALAALITGILAMHVWVGGHGATSHHVSTSPAVQLGSEAAPEGLQNAGTLVEVPGHSADASPAGCADTCGENSLMTGICVIALMAIGSLWLYLRRTRIVPFAGQSRAPPVLTERTCVSRITPSLTQLSISRT